MSEIMNQNTLPIHHQGKKTSQSVNKMHIITKYEISAKTSQDIFSFCQVTAYLGGVPTMFFCKPDNSILYFLLRHTFNNQDKFVL